MKLSLSQGEENGRPYQIVTARWKLIEENGVLRVYAALNDDVVETYSRRIAGGWGEFDQEIAEASAELKIPNYYPSGIYSLSYIRMEDDALNVRDVYFTDGESDEDPATVEIWTTLPDLVPPVLDLNQVTIKAVPTKPQSPDGETRVDVTFRVKDNISGYSRADMILRDPQGVEHSFTHLDSSFYDVYFSGAPTIFRSYHNTIILPVGSIPGTWGMTEMTVWDKASNRFVADFTEMIHFEVLDPDSNVVIYQPVQAVPKSLSVVSGDDQESQAGAVLEAPFVVSVLDQNGIAYAGAAVVFSVASGNGKISAETVITDHNGQASVTLTLGNRPGLNSVEVRVADLDPVVFTAVGQAVPHILDIVSRETSNRARWVLCWLDLWLFRCWIKMVSPMLVGGVTFTITAGEGKLSEKAVTTDSSGQAASILTLVSHPGPTIVEVTVEGLEPITFTVVAQPTPDFDGDGVTNFADFFLFADAFGTYDARFDLDGSGTVDFGDFFLFADAFGRHARAKLLALAREWMGLPDESQLQQNRPNPFNSQTRITFFLLNPGPVRVEVFALTGQRVAVLDQGQKKAGIHRLHWDGRNREGRPLASGIYLYRLVTAREVLTRKLTLLQ